MFNSARIKLTTWYLAIIMIVSMLFSAIIFRLVSLQLERLVRPRPFLPDFVAMEIIEEQKTRLLWSLVTINVVILITSGGASYFLAGKTLKPIQEMMVEQSQFISDASHELRTPIATLRAEMEGKLLEKNITENDMRKLITSNLEDLDRLQKLADGLLKLTRVHSINKKELNQISTNKVIENAVRKINVLAEKKQIKIIKKCSDLSVKADNEQISEAICILIENAIKYSKEKTNIEVTCKKSGQEAIISVKDQGVGIALDDVPHIFERFYRADKSRSVVTGYGLGLAIAKKIIENNNGRIEVKSVLDKGSTFSIYLPLA